MQYNAFAIGLWRHQHTCGFRSGRIGESVKNSNLLHIKTTRRGFLAAAGSGAGLIAGAALTSADAAVPGIALDDFPTQNMLWADVLYMNSYGTRYPGTAAHKQYTAFLDSRFRDAGLTVDRLERNTLDLWEPQRWSITTKSGKNIAVASPNRESASTGPEGVTAPLKYCGRAKGTVFAAKLDSQNVPHIDIPANVAGRIALIEVEVEPLPFAKMFEGHVAAVVDPTTAGGMPVVQPMATAWNNVESRLPKSLEDDLRRAGAVGVIYAWVNGADADASGQLRRNGTAALPSLWVGTTGARQLRAIETAGEPITLMVEVKVTPKVTTATTIATLPGLSEETILLWTNTDGMNAIQENGTVAMINLMRYFAHLPIASRKRSISCVMSEGHLALNHTPDIWWTQQRPDILAKAVASLSMEHMGCREWIGDPSRNTFAGTGRPDVSWAFTFAPEDRPNYLAKVMKEALADSRLARTVVVDNSPFSFSPGLHPWTLAGVPSIGYISTPAYFNAEGPNGHIDKICPEQYYDQVKTMARAIRLLDAAPRDLLRQT
jgi:hypothetical protein